MGQSPQNLLLLGRGEGFGDFDRSNASKIFGSEKAIVVRVSSVELKVVDCAESGWTEEIFHRAGETKSSHAGFLEAEMSKLIEQSFIGRYKGHHGLVREERKYVEKKDPVPKFGGMHCNIVRCSILD